MKRLANLLPCLGLAALAGAAAAAPSTAWRTNECARARFHADRIAALERSYRGAPGFDAFLEQEQADLAEALENLVGDVPPARPPGARIEAYFAGNDGSAQPFWSYVPHSAPPPEEAGSGMPLLVYLHGYVPYYDLVNVPAIPSPMTSIAERASACIAVPFGRSNTDFQGVGEQDVLRVIDEMVERYPVDRGRVVLAGYSMGGMGAWSIGGRFAERFNALFVMSGRSDYYLWNETTPGETAPWLRPIVDTQFGSAWLPRLLDTPVLAVHGALDPLVPLRQGRYPVDLLRKSGGDKVEWIVFPDEAHGIAATALEDPRILDFLETNLREHNPRRPAPLGRVPGFTGSRLQDAFLGPFRMISPSRALLERRAAEWRRFAKGEPPRLVERGGEDALPPHALRGCNLFVFGEPETSPLARRILEAGGVTVEDDAFVFEGRRLPRTGNGLWFTGRNPGEPARTAVVQCGVDWGAGLPENHLYDRLPDVMAYSKECDGEGANVVVAAGAFDAVGAFRWLDAPAAPEPVIPPSGEGP
ncbi:MAG: prolyl oligopeptidase family serine peptidase [Kiritimatiellia bacterium]|jgi:predicted esterase